MRAWLVFIASTLLPKLAHGRPPAGGPPRYVMCTEPHRPPEVNFGSAALRIFAASIAAPDGWRHSREGRPHRRVTLRAALMVDEMEGWTVSGQEIFGKAADLSYAKCSNAGISADLTHVACRATEGGVPDLDLMMGLDNSSWMPGQLIRFWNTELKHDFIECALEPSVFTQAPPKLFMQLRIRMLQSKGFASWVSMLPLDLCRVDEPFRTVSMCTQPLYGHGMLRQEHSTAFDDWMMYHMRYLGVEHAEVYDVDGSFKEVVEPWLRGARGVSVSYHGAWPDGLSRHLRDISRKHPYCSETWAYAHCLTTHRATSRWVLMLALDEYLTVKNDNMMHRERILPSAMWMLEKKFLAEADKAGAKPPLMWMVHALSFARGGPEAPSAATAKVLTLTLQERSMDLLPAKYTADSIIRAWYGAPGNEWTENSGRDVTAEVKETLEAGAELVAANYFFGDPARFTPKVLLVQVYDEVDGHTPAERAGVVSASRLRSKKPYGLVPIADPAGCMCAGPHTCYAAANVGGSGYQVWDLPSDIFVVNHYVEMLSVNVGRCNKGGRKEECNIPDTAALWIPRWLRELGDALQVADDGEPRVDEASQVG